MNGARAPAAAQGIDIRIPNPIDLLLSATGFKTYKLTNACRKFLAPYIVNQEAYDKLIASYGGKKSFFGRDGLDVVVRLGIVRSHPEWLTQEALEQINKQYRPPSRTRTELLHSISAQYASGSFFLSGNGGFDGQAIRLVQSGNPAPAGAAGTASAITSAELIAAAQAATRSISTALRLPGARNLAAIAVATIVVFELNRASLFKYLTPEAQAIVVAAESTVCQNAEGGCTQTAGPGQIGAGRGNGRKPCVTVSGRIIPVGTIGFRPLDTPPKGRSQHGIEGAHYNIYIAQQNPNNQQCFWNPAGAVRPNELPSGAVPIERFFP